MLAHDLVGGLSGGDGLFLQAFANLSGLLGCGFQLGSKLVLLCVSMFCCFHTLFPLLTQSRTAVEPSQQPPLRCVAGAHDWHSQACVTLVSTVLRIAASFRSKDSTILNCTRARSALWPGRCTLK